MKKYKLYDLIDGYGLIGEFDTKTGVACACTHHADDTEDYCMFELYVLTSINKYELVFDWKYNKHTLIIKEV